MATEPLAADARYYEYMSAADPDMRPIPYAVFPPSLHSREPTCLCPPALCTCPCAAACARTTSAVIPLDLSQALGATYPCTSPALLATFIALVRAAPPVAYASTSPDAAPHANVASNASSHMFFVIRGSGRTTAVPVGVAAAGEVDIEWSSGDLFTLPACNSINHSGDGVLYSNCDGPLLRYLNAAPGRSSTLTPTMYRAHDLNGALRGVMALSDAGSRNRNGVLLGHASTADSTLTLTPTLWALYNALPAGVTQRAHKHASVAIDLCVAAGDNTETVMATGVDDEGELLPPLTRAVWRAGGVFITPPNVWHSHVNASSMDAIVLPTQDAGLHTHMRTLNITFAPVKKDGDRTSEVGKRVAGAEAGTQA